MLFWLSFQPPGAYIAAVWLRHWKALLRNIRIAYYYFVGCPTGACPLTSNPFITMAYMGFIGWLLSGIFGKGCSGSCNTQ